MFSACLYLLDLLVRGVGGGVAPRYSTTELGLELRRNEDGGVAGVLYATAISYQVATEAAHRDY